MGKEKFLHDRRPDHASDHPGRHAIVKAVDSVISKLQAFRKEQEVRFAGTVEQEILFFPDEVEEGLVDEQIQYDVWLEQVKRTNSVYNASISETEDSRLKPD